MAMTKLEKSLLEMAFTQASFYRTPPVSRDLPPPAYDWRKGSTDLPPGYGFTVCSHSAWRDGQVISKGWDFNTYNGRVEKACSSSSYHGHNWEDTSSQQTRALFSTKLRALQALRHAIEQETMVKLRAVDKMIEEEFNTPTPIYEVQNDAN